MSKIISLAATGTVLALAVGAFAVPQAFAKDVTLVLDGEVHTLRSNAGTVEQLLATNKITLGEHDVIMPEPSNKLDNKEEVRISFGRPVQLSVNNSPVETRWTTATTVESAVNAFAIPVADAKLSQPVDAPIPRSGIALSVETAKDITVTSMAGTKDIRATGTVSDALLKAGITLDSDDTVTPALTAQLTPGMAVKVVAVETKNTVKTQVVAFAEERKNDTTLAQGTTKVEREGKAGSQVETWEQRYENGVLASEKKVASGARVEPTSKIIRVGTKQQTPASVPAGSSINWDRLAQCESSGNWSIANGNGFYGGIQFTAQTWLGFGGGAYAPTANLATREQQIAIGEKVLATQGLRAWPGCVAKGMY